MCKAPNQKAYVRQNNIDKADVYIFASGMIVYTLDIYTEVRQIMIPPGTESCDLRNIR